MLIFTDLLNSNLSDKQILFQIARVNSWINLKGKIPHSYKSIINIDVRGLSAKEMASLGYTPSTIIRNKQETDYTLFQKNCASQYNYIIVPDSFFLDDRLSPAEKVLLLVLREVWFKNDGTQYLDICQTSTIHKVLPNYKHTNDYIDKLISKLAKKHYISYTTEPRLGRTNVRISWDGSLKDANAELEKVSSAEEELAEMTDNVDDLKKELERAYKKIAELERENSELMQQKELIKQNVASIRKVTKQYSKQTEYDINNVPTNLRMKFEVYKKDWPKADFDDWYNRNSINKAKLGGNYE